MISIDEKLKNFPKVYFISLVESESRRDFMQKQFDKYNINGNCMLVERFEKIKDTMKWTGMDYTPGCHLGTITSYLNLLKYWYENTDEQYAIFCDDDISFESIDYWDFTWNDFMNSLPSDWDAIQLLRMDHEWEKKRTLDPESFKLKLLRGRWWGASGMLSRNYVKRILDAHFKDGVYNINIPHPIEWHKTIENILYLQPESKVYNFPLLLEAFDPLESTYVVYNQTTEQEYSQEKNFHRVSRDLFLNAWKEQRADLNNKKENTTMMSSLCQYVLSNGGSIHSLVVPAELTNGTGIFNPSVYNDNGTLYVNIRHCQVTMYHAEKNIYENQWGPLIYLNPENDITLTTTNFFAKLTPNLEIDYTAKIDMSKFDVPPIWEFRGLEDGRFVRWEDKFYIIGVRRDTNTIGSGRMEYTELDVNEETKEVKEISRSRIPGPPPDTWYCEKNWMPIVDKPHHFIRWANPLQIVKVDPVLKTCEVVYENTEKLPIPKEQRGSSHVIPFKEGYLFITHECDLWRNESGKKDSFYRHRFYYMDKNYKILNHTEPFNFMSSQIEFCCGITEYGDDLLISFGVQDNAAYILRCPKHLIENAL
jgi:predicted GH43/DUF377 family glycosyl hydrolase